VENVEAIERGRDRGDRPRGASLTASRGRLAAVVARLRSPLVHG